MGHRALPRRSLRRAQDQPRGLPLGDDVRAGRIKTTETGAPDPATARRSYSYYYNPNRSLIELADEIPDFPGAPQDFAFERTTEIARDAAERERRVNESWRGGRDSAFGYDAAGNVTTRKLDGKLTDGGSPCPGEGSGCTYEGGRIFNFTYDALDRERRLAVDTAPATDGPDEGTDPTDDPDRLTMTEWWPSDQMRERTKPNDTVESRYYLPSAEISAKVRDPRQGATETQTYAYDLNGNRSFDERGAHAFNARDQLVSWSRPAEQGPGAAPAGHSYAEAIDPDSTQGTTTYTLDGTGQQLESDAQGLKEQVEFKLGDVIQPRVERTTDTHTDYTYEDGILRSARTTVDSSTALPDQEPEEESETVVAHYERYDDLGNVGRIRQTGDSEPGGGPDTPAPAPGCGAEIATWKDAAAPRRTTFHCYDPFSRLIASQAPSAENDENPKPAESWIYDGLDRRDARLVDDAGTDVKELSYVGTSQLLSREQVPGAEPSSDPDETKSYDYDSQGLRLGIDVKQGTEQKPYSAYDLDGSGSVIGLEDSEGTFDDPDSAGTDDDNRYHFDPYGGLVDPDPGDILGQDAETELPEAAQENPFRFEGFYYDSGIQSYDMQARQYRPDVGRFLSQDRFEAAGADLQLQSDPLTQNRYAFAGGNPVSNVEFDGHDPCPTGPDACKGNASEDRVTPGVRDGDGSSRGKSSDSAAENPYAGEPAVSSAPQHDGESLAIDANTGVIETTSSSGDVQAVSPPALGVGNPANAAAYRSLYGAAQPSTTTYELPKDLGPDEGTFRFNWFIPYEEAGLPLLGRLRGDDRDADPRASTTRSRAVLEANFESDKLTLLVNPSCAGDSCKDARPIQWDGGNNFRPSINDDGSVTIEYGLEQSVIDSAVSPAISGEIQLSAAPESELEYQIDERADNFPAREAYQYGDGSPEQIYYNGPGGAGSGTLGPLLLSDPFRGLP